MYKGKRKNIKKEIGTVSLITLIVSIFALLSMFFVRYFDTGFGQKFGTVSAICLDDSEVEQNADKSESLSERDNTNNIDFCSVLEDKYCVNDMSLLSVFTTSIHGSSAERVANIKLACRAIDGVVVGGGEQFSFNDTVGERTIARGYKQSVVIYKGMYTKGVGGGVCQVSTTLYNAWLLAGLDGVDVHHHTIPTKYVDLSRDATVSQYTDMRLINNQSTPIKIVARVAEEQIIVGIYGAESGAEYRLVSETDSSVPPMDAPIIYIDVEDKAQESDIYYEGKCGYNSRLIREKYEGERLVARGVIRVDYYPPQPGQRVVKRVK